MFDIRPILSTLRRHKTASALIVLEIALSCAIICNAVFLIGTRIERIERPSGVAESEIVRIQLTGIGRDDNAEALSREDVAALQAIPGVKAAALTNQIPYGNSSWNTSINLAPDQENPTMNAAMYLGDEQLLEALGLQLVAGRDFNDDEYVDWESINAADSKTTVPAIIITRAMAEKLFPGESAIGKSIYASGKEPKRVVGVIETLIRPGNASPATLYDSMIMPIRVPYSIGSNYVLRTDPDRRDEVLKAAVDKLDQINPNRILLKDETFEVLRDKFYAQDRAMVWLLVAVCIGLLVVTALGIVGLASFWVQQRTKQIGVRRALGATRGQILRYFQTENFLLASVGIALGMAMAYGINQLLMQHYELARLPAIYLPIGAITLWVLGQLAVFGPARRAAAVPPAVATRSV
ncbi:ABC transporter permease [Lysobacter concretionis Ko07 = DSM 16239]|uniref:ABC transporter permease n=1 Tax=Lysobacter concretionis Ko07 = DSM 16239 TaxID=1122185 RepID=A0A0A0EM10_9GAMM|nr:MULTISPECIES: FtsX-like permease family protein [Lysobacter]KGM51183.1 ABC transporter permease [Lysobacter concretionis Ko07 = DSM 16239]QOD90831.1 ABC transporter permease [Lysobacter sp. CW239]